ncbi:unnamed protein product [Prorocentrum cordatum]|uniref:Uncharacterized protein n=1 Tax=Prorocentrum cordatum TaxID=2364126 RepID=A0ABN9UCR6_9DINO|nr:unnamed protein product [Polarella glacialis]
MVVAERRASKNSEDSDDGGEALKWVRVRKGYHGTSTRATVRQAKPGATAAQRATVRPGSLSTAVLRATQARLRAEGRPEEAERVGLPAEAASARSQASDFERRTSGECPATCWCPPSSRT